MPFRNLLLALVMLTVSCSYFVSWEDANKNAVGEHIKNITDIWGPPNEVRTQSDGFSIWRYNLEEVDSSCVHYWIVNSEGIIIDFYHEGYCRPIG